MPAAALGNLKVGHMGCAQGSRDIFAPLIAKVALKFSYTEYFSIALFGIIMVITSSSPIPSRTFTV